MWRAGEREAPSLFLLSDRRLHFFANETIRVQVQKFFYWKDFLFTADFSSVAGTAPASLASSYSLFGHVFSHWLWLSSTSTAVSAVKTWCNAAREVNCELGFPGTKRYECWRSYFLLGCNLSIITHRRDWQHYQWNDFFFAKTKISKRTKILFWNFPLIFFSYYFFSSDEKMGVGWGGAQKGRKKLLSSCLASNTCRNTCQIRPWQYSQT